MAHLFYDRFSNPFFRVNRCHPLLFSMRFPIFSIWTDTNRLVNLIERAEFEVRPYLLWTFFLYFSTLNSNNRFLSLKIFIGPTNSEPRTRSFSIRGRSFQIVHVLTYLLSEVFQTIIIRIFDMCLWLHDPRIDFSSIFIYYVYIIVILFYKYTDNKLFGFLSGATNYLPYFIGNSWIASLHKYPRTVSSVD